MDVEARLAAYREEIARLEERVAELESLNGFDLITPVEWRLTPSESRLFGHLYARDMATKESLLVALVDPRSTNEMPEIKIVDVFVCKMRKKLEAFDITIETLWGHGYRIPPEVKTRIKPLMEPEKIERMKHAS